VNLGAIGTIVSALVTILFGIGSVIGIRQRRLTKKAQDLRELREMNLEAMKYIYQLEYAFNELSVEYGVKLNFTKPDILKKSYLEKKAATEKNNELQQIAQVLEELGKRVEKIPLGGTDD
jgi:hypothetical protein